MYAKHGTAHFDPFIGDAFEDRRPGAFRVLAVGINSYVSTPHWNESAGMSGWLRAWWTKAAQGNGGTFRFYTRAFRETCKLGSAMVSSPLFGGLQFDTAPETKATLYATNAVKVFTTEQHKRSTGITPEVLEPYRDTWHAELNALADHGVFPHLIVAFGGQIWEHVWRAFDTTMHAQPNFRVLRHETCGHRPDVVYHHANRFEVESNGGSGTVFVVRLHHPQARTPDARRAEWLLAQADFRSLAALG